MLVLLVAFSLKRKKSLNLRPTDVDTCDYVDGDGGAYPTVRAALNQLGSFEDIIMAGAPAADTAAVAVLYSETSDIWLETAGT